MAHPGGAHGSTADAYHVRSAGIDVGVLAWLLNDFPLAPLPMMLVPFSSRELADYRSELRDRFKALAKEAPLG